MLSRTCCRPIGFLDSDALRVTKQTILPDEENQLVELLQEWSKTCDLILTTGGTGLSERDRTPEATLRVAERIIPGISEGLRQLSLEKHHLLC